MNDKVRLVLIDPNPGSRRELQRLIAATAELELVEVCPAYGASVPRVAALMPDVAVVVIDDDPAEALAVVENMATSHPGVELLPAGSEADGGMILRAVRAGAREFLPLPSDARELLDAVRRLKPRVAPDSGPRGPQVIAVTGAAGGVGCTSLSVNLAAALTKLSRRETVLVDFDLLLGSLEESLAVIPDNSVEVLVRNLEEMDPDLLKRWLPRHPCGLYVVPHPVAMEHSARLEPGDLQQVLNLLRATFDTIVIDTSKALQATDFLAFEAADVILVVLQLTLNGTRNTVRLLQYLRMFDGFAEKIKLVVNRVNSPLSEISVKKAEELLKTSIRWQVPNATKLFKPARTLGIPIDEVDEGSGSKAHEAILEIARELHPFPAELPRRRRRMFSSFL